MPLQYESIISEHLATRARATLFDVSHMGRFRFDGPDAGTFLDRLVTRRVTNLKPNQIRYGLMTNEQGGILDDVLIYYLVDHDGTPFHWMVVNAGNRQKIIDWLQPHLAQSNVHFTDETRSTAMISVQGPLAVPLAAQLMDLPLADLPYYNGRACRVANVPALVSRTGYTGEDGCEIIVAGEEATSIWEQLLRLGQADHVVAAGLGARDTLRLEAAMPLYGHELSESINPFQAGLGFAVHLKDREFIGREALVKIKADKQQPQRVGLRLAGKRVPREHYPVFEGEREIGVITSGTFSPTFQCPIAMAYVPAHVAVGQVLEIDLRGKRHPATVVELPFYQRNRQSGSS